MEAYIKRVQMNPTKRNKDRVITQEKHAQVVLVVPAESEKQLEAIIELYNHMNGELVDVDIDSEQQQLPLGESPLVTEVKERTA